jgi:hypothetical protein
MTLTQNYLAALAGGLVGVPAIICSSALNADITVHTSTDCASYPALHFTHVSEKIMRFQVNFIQNYL